jgi:hypothetical protein
MHSERWPDCVMLPRGTLMAQVRSNFSALAFGGRTAVQSQPRSRASRAAAMRLGAPSLRMASDR